MKRRITRRKKKSDQTILKVFKLILIYSVIAFVLILIFMRIKFFLTHAGIFDIQEIVREDSQPLFAKKYLNRFKGKNIFLVPLTQIEQHLKKANPHLIDLRVSRKLPNGLVIASQKIEPFAIVQAASNNMIVDARGFFISSGVGEFVAKLPVILISRLYQKPVIGRQVKGDAVILALNVLKRIKSEKQLQSLEVKVLDVSNSSKIECIFDNDLKVFLSENNYGVKISQLGSLFHKSELDLEKIVYIDLRFREPLVGQKGL